MNNIPSSSILPEPRSTFSVDSGDANESPAQFLKFLRNDLIATHLSRDPSVRIPSSDKQNWVSVISGLSDYFLVTFPIDCCKRWKFIHEKIKLAETTLEVIERAMLRVDGLLVGNDEFVKKQLGVLLSLCVLLSDRADSESQSAQSDGDFPSPQALRLRTVSTLADMLRCMGANGLETDKSSESAWKTMKTILSQLIGLGQDVLNVPSDFVFPSRVSLFDIPRMRELGDTASTDLCLNLTIHSSMELLKLLGLLLEVVTTTLCPPTTSLFPVTCGWLLTDVARETIKVSQLAFARSSGSSPTMHIRQQIECLTQAVITAISLSRSASHVASEMQRALARCMLLTLLRLRLKGRDKIKSTHDWAVADQRLLHADTAEIFKMTSEGCTSASLSFEMQPVLEPMLNALKDRESDEGKPLRMLIYAILTQCIRLLKPEEILMIQQTLGLITSEYVEEDEKKHIRALTDDITTSVSTLNDQDQDLMQVDFVESSGPGGSVDGSWRSKLQTSIEDLIRPYELSWAEGDVLDDGDYVQKALDEIETRFNGFLEDSFSVEVYISRVEQLAKLPTLIPPAMTNRRIIPVYLSIVEQLLQSVMGHTSPKLRRLAYDALAKALTRAPDGRGEGERVTKLAMLGLVDKQRGVRLGAGVVVVNLVASYQAGGAELAARTGPIFTAFYQLLDQTKGEPVKESAVVILGRLGRDAKAQVRGQAICCLIAQLGKQSPVIKGTAYMQLLSLAKDSTQSPYSLLSPYMSQIAPFVISRMCTQPTLLTEFSRFLSVSPTDFSTATLARTLPVLFANRERKVLDKLSADLHMKTSALFLKHSAEILKQVFLFEDEGGTEEALAFVIRVLREAAESAWADGMVVERIDEASVVKSSMIPLLAELVIALGDLDEGRVRAAREALKKVANTQSGIAPSGSPEQDLGEFLTTYMLGVISHMNDALHDVQGKKSVDLKKQILRSLGVFISYIGPSAASVAPQIMATLQTMLSAPDLAHVTLETWYKFLTTLEPEDIGPYIGSTSASFVVMWPRLSDASRAIVRTSLIWLVAGIGEDLAESLHELVDLSPIPELADINAQLTGLRQTWTQRERLQRVLALASSDNLTVATQSLCELKRLLLFEQKDSIKELASGDVFDPLIGRIVAVLLEAACRDGDETGELRLLAYECIGIIGALDPDRFEMGFRDSDMIVLNNFQDEEETIQFALHLVKDVLVGAYRSTSDIRYQNYLAYAIQGLLPICRFTPAVINSSASLPIKVRNRWNSLPRHVLETVTPLLEARYTLQLKDLPDFEYPIYPAHDTYRAWLQVWSSQLITDVSGDQASAIFSHFQSAIRNKDVTVAHHLLPHLVLNILVSGNENHAQNIRTEILAVLEDQFNTHSTSTSDKKLLSAQVIFMLMDHLNKWVRQIRQEINGQNNKRTDKKRSRASTGASDAEMQLMHVDSVLSSIDHGLIARAALQCQAYARSLMSFEHQILALREHLSPDAELQGYYERLHEIYAHLDEPDGMEGVSSLILSPSLEHQIRQHESTGRWTSAQSCWEVRLQQSPDNLDFHLGLLRCLRNLGHYDTLRTHVKGVLIRNPDWESALSGYQVESAWMVNDWEEVQNVVYRTDATTPPVAIASLLLAMREGDEAAMRKSLEGARSLLGSPIAASGPRGYRRAYEAVLNLHLVHELNMIHQIALECKPSNGLSASQRKGLLQGLTHSLSTRLGSVLPTYRVLEPVLSMRRTAFKLRGSDTSTSELGRSWLTSAKIARKASHWQTAYSAMLQARQAQAPFSFIESARLVKVSGEPLRALQEMENSLKLADRRDADIIDLTDDLDEGTRLRAKAQLLLARWMNESDRYDDQVIWQTFKKATDLWPIWESGQFHLGRFHDACYKKLSPRDAKLRGPKMVVHTIKSFTKAMTYGSKYVYQAIPRILTLWLDLGENESASSDSLAKANAELAKAIKNVPVYKWYTAFPQIVSRVGHTNREVYALLRTLIAAVIQEYPKQSLWLFTSVVKSTKKDRELRGREILDQLKANPSNAKTELPSLINESMNMINELLRLCDHPVKDERKLTFNMTKDFPRLSALAPSRLIIPLQESLTASLPPASSARDRYHQPFPSNLPTFKEFFDEIEIMRSLAKPRKITVRGDDGHIYTFLGKPKDDLRKDARLMDFNAIINKLLKANSESRRRQLHIRTYGVVTLNEECGFIQWVPHTIPVRPILVKSYDDRNIKSWSNAMGEAFARIKEVTDKEGAEIFVNVILSQFPPVFHEWFIETFPEPSAWLASRLAYGRTAAVMSMIGFILGLGDRHCENILLDVNTGDLIHVDFNCLFEKGKTLETPERVPFRLTQNMVDGLGITGVEGVFRIACEVTLQLLRDNKDTLMSVLDAFVHDPLVEWEDEKRKLERNATRRSAARGALDLRSLAKTALNAIDKKLKGVYTTGKDRPEKEISTSSLVQILIQESTDISNLAKMYPGWAPWH